MNPRTLFYLLVISLLFIQDAKTEEPTPPNIVFILTDGLGYGDLSCYGAAGVKTPRIDQLAKQGVKFTQWYANGSESTPSQTAILTGRYPQRVGGMEASFGSGNVGRYNVATALAKTNDLGLPATRASLAPALKSVGYQTAVFGEWHLGSDPKFNPINQGFDLFRGFLSGSDVYLNGTKPVKREGQITKLITSDSIDFIKSQEVDTPFFLYIPLSKGKAETRDKYIELVEGIDQAVGQVLDTLDEYKKTENTIVVFASDHGAKQPGSNATYRGFEGSLFEGGIRVPCIVRWPEKITPNTVSNQVGTLMDLTCSFFNRSGTEKNYKLDGDDILQHIIDKEKDYPRTIAWTAINEDSSWNAIRIGDYKYLSKWDNGKTHRWYFDLQNNPTETKPLLTTDQLDDKSGNYAHIDFTKPIEAPFLQQHLSQWLEETSPTRPRQLAWEKALFLTGEDRHQEAAELYQQIYTEAKLDNKPYESAFARAAKLFTQNHLPDDQTELHEALINEVPLWPEAIQPLFHGIIAKDLWGYLQSYIWDISNRSLVENLESNDLLTWDLNRFHKEIEHHFSKALHKEDGIDSIENRIDYRLFYTDANRPTIADVIAYEAINYHLESSKRTQSDFVIFPDSPIFKDSETFLAWDLSKETSHLAKGIRLIQRFSQYHSQKKEAPFYTLELQRFEIGYKHCQTTTSERDEINIESLKNFAENEAINLNFRMQAYTQWVGVLKNQSKFVEAINIAHQALQLTAKGKWAEKCTHLIETIKQPYASAKTESTWNSFDPPEFEVTYKNLNKVWFRLVLNSTRYYKTSNVSVNSAQAKTTAKRLIESEPTLQWSQDLPATKDYQKRTQSINVPEEIPSGSYYLITSFNQNFTTDNKLPNTTSYTPVQVSDYTMVFNSDSNKIHAWVLDSKTGQPIPNASIKQFKYSYETKWKLFDQKITDENGQASFVPTHVDFGNRSNFIASFKNQKIGANYTWRSKRIAAPISFDFFTDRKIYSPGDTLHFKGILRDSSHLENRYEFPKDISLRVELRDVNRKIIKHLDLKTNQYGSFSGEFTLPRNRLNGKMSLSVKCDEYRNRYHTNGNTFRVEEYKSPKFKVEFDPVKQAKINQKVTVTGTAQTYTGAPSPDAKVDYVISRSVDFPRWVRRYDWFWNGDHQYRDSEEIARSTVLTDKKGRFEINFNALANPRVSKKSNPIFQYRLEVTVTDQTGEFKTKTMVFEVAHHTMTATMQANECQTNDKPVSIIITSKDLNNALIDSTGIIDIYSLKSPEQIHRKSLLNPRNRLSDIQNWPIDKKVSSHDYVVKGAIPTALAVNLDTGCYRAMLKSTDTFGTAVETSLDLKVIDPNQNKFPHKLPFSFDAESWELQPGDTFKAVWGSGYESAMARVEFLHKDKVIKSFWTDKDKTQQIIGFPVEEIHRGGLECRIFSFHDNRFYQHSQVIEVPWTNKNLAIKWKRFRSKLLPTEKVSWTAQISGKNADLSAIEMVATLYDQSLDSLYKNDWLNRFSFYQNSVPRKSKSLSSLANLRELSGNWPSSRFYFRSNRPFFFNHFRRYSDYLGLGGGALDAFAVVGGYSEPEAFDFGQVKIRKNLVSTAFFYPHLESQKDGSVEIEFSMPETLTTWQFKAFAHDQASRSGYLEDTAITALDVMIQPFPPRFVREGDQLHFTARVSNQSDTLQTGQVRLALKDLASDQPIDKKLGNETTTLDFSLPARQSRTFSWPITIPDNQGPIIYQSLVTSGKYSDGEEGSLPVIPRRIMLTESLPLWVRGKETREYTFKNLISSNDSNSLEHHNLHIDVVSNPAWYAVLALPYLTDFPHECSEQTFSRYYANKLASHIAQTNPLIQKTYATWAGLESKTKPSFDNSDSDDPFGGSDDPFGGGDDPFGSDDPFGGDDPFGCGDESFDSDDDPDQETTEDAPQSETPAQLTEETLLSPLETNQYLKAVLIEETPWLLEAQHESSQRHKIKLLFDQARIQRETDSALNKLRKQQHGDGSFSWFEGGQPNFVITLYIATGFARLEAMGVENIELSFANKAIDWLDQEIQGKHQRQLENPKGDKITPTISLYLYCRSHYIKNKPIAPKTQAAIDYYLSHAESGWWRNLSRQSKAHLAIAAHRLTPKSDLPQQIMRNILADAVTDEEMGMFWNNKANWLNLHRWDHARIETQVAIIEMLLELKGPEKAIEDCRVWLIKHKQTNSWSTTKATVDAIYALLIGKPALLESNTLAEISLGGTAIKPKPADVEVGTGRYEKRIPKPDINPELGKIELTQKGDGMAWASVNWQYFETVEKVKANQGTALQLEKTLYKRKGQGNKAVLVAVTPDTPLTVGDELVSRITLRTDRDMEFIHLKDHRGSGTEPINILSKYRYHNNFYYYESTKDTASHFYIDTLPKGTHVFEYSVRVAHKGTYQSGIATIQCMYAPEFNSHSESTQIVVK